MVFRIVLAHFGAVLLKTALELVEASHDQVSVLLLVLSDRVFGWRLLSPLAPGRGLFRRLLLLV